MRRAQNSRQDLDQAREENQESQRGKCRESLREGERHAAYFAAAMPKQTQRNREGWEDGAATLSRETAPATGIVTGSWRESLSASAPASRLSATATPSVCRNPSVGKKKKPATNVPTTAPAVLTQ